jgi:hypothetical protein
MHTLEALKTYTASELAARIAVGSIDPVDVIQLSIRPGACLATIGHTQVVRSLAAQKKRECESGQALGALHGVPVAVFLPPKSPSTSNSHDTAAGFRSALSRAGAITITAGSVEMVAKAAVAGEVSAAVAILDDANDLARTYGLFSFSPECPASSQGRIAGFARCADDLALLPFCPLDDQPLRLSQRTWKVGIARQSAHCSFETSLTQIAAAGVTVVDIDLAASLSLHKKWDEPGNVVSFQARPAFSSVAVAPRRGRCKDNTDAVRAELFGGLDAIVIPARVRYESAALAGLPTIFVPTCDGDGLVILGKPGSDRNILQFARYAEAAIHCMDAAA